MAWLNNNNGRLLGPAIVGPPHFPCESTIPTTLLSSRPVDPSSTSSSLPLPPSPPPAIINGTAIHSQSPSTQAYRRVRARTSRVHRAVRRALFQSRPIDLSMPPLALRHSPPTAANQSLIADNGRSLNKKRRPKPGITNIFLPC